MELKKLICAYLTIVLCLTGCGNLKSQIKGNQNTDASADQPTGSIIKRDTNEIVEKVEKQEENKSALVNIENNGDNLNVADGNNQNGDNNQSNPPSEELEPTWQDKAKKYVDDARQFLYKIVYSLRYENVLLEINQLQRQEALQLYQLEEHRQDQQVKYQSQLLHHQHSQQQQDYDLLDLAQERQKQLQQQINDLQQYFQQNQLVPFCELQLVNVKMYCLKEQHKLIQQLVQRCQQQEQLVQCHRQQEQQLAELAEQLRLQANRFFNFKLL